MCVHLVDHGVLIVCFVVGFCVWLLLFFLHSFVFFLLCFNHKSTTLNVFMRMVQFVFSVVVVVTNFISFFFSSVASSLTHSYCAIGFTYNMVY